MELTELKSNDILEYIVKEYVRNVSHIYDKDYQQKVWIRSVRPKCNTFSETVNICSKTAEYILSGHKEFGISKIQLNIIKKFYDLLKKFLEQNILPQRFIDTPEWTNITLMAKEVLEVLGCYTKYLNKESSLTWLCEELAQISNKEYQRRVWIRGEGPECDDFDEAVCRYSSVAEWILTEYMELGICDAQLSILLEFHKKFAGFWQNNDLPQSFIDTLEWTEITLMAKNVLDAFSDQNPQ